MKFSDGQWNDREGYTVYSPAEARDVKSDGKTLTVFAPYKQIDEWDQCMEEISWILKWAEKYDHSKNYNALFLKYSMKKSDDMNNLLY